ncbi:MAG: outer membrane protein transport protein [Sandaracinaceae bacterium]|nr:outer membrane protein transport protein [Sandaracinaceae bacterium]
MTRQNKMLRAASLGLLLGLLGSASPAQAGGFYFQDRGTRPAGRGFAFVAGADDPQALHYNPAGLAYSGQQLLLDVSFTWFRGEYTRVDSGGNTLPTIDLDTIPLPIPGLAYSHPLSDEFTLGVGLLVPNALLGDYPDGVTADGAPCNPDEDPACQAAPQRYSLYSLAGTALVQLDMALAWRPHPRISFGAGLGVLLGNFNAEVGLSACDNAICAQRENPDFDARASMSLERFWDLAPHVGVIVDLDKLRLGASLRFYPRGIQGTADLRVRLPADPFFEGAAVDGDKARVNIELPVIFRVGAEVRLLDSLRLEGAFVWERWSRQEEISIQPIDVTLTDVTAIGDYAVGALSILRDMNDTISLRLGGELSVLDGRMDLRAGVAFESSGFDNRTLTAMTIDTRKVSLGFGGSIQVTPGFYLDVTYAHVFLQNRTVTNSAVQQPNGIRPPTSGADAVYIGNGRYEWSADMFAVGLRYQFDAGDAPAEPPPAEPEAAPSTGADEPQPQPEGAPDAL